MTSSLCGGASSLWPDHRRHATLEGRPGLVWRDKPLRLHCSFPPAVGRTQLRKSQTVIDKKDTSPSADFPTPLGIRQRRHSILFLWKKFGAPTAQVAELKEQGLEVRPGEC